MRRAVLIQKLFEKGKIFTFSNFLSFIRLLGGFFLYQVMVQQRVALALVIIVLMIITDFADGYFARKLNQISEMGKVLDPLADKFCVALGMIALYQSYSLPMWILIVIIGRDLLILLGSAVLISKLPYVTPSAIPGKIAVTVLTILTLSYLLKVEWLYLPMQILTMISLAVSSAHYGYRFYNKLTPKNN